MRLSILIISRRRFIALYQSTNSTVRAWILRLFW
nr:MAG TPA: hypothetical protein [Bacteriophage sp.]